MSATGFEVFDTTVQTTNAWLKENHGGDRAGLPKGLSCAHRCVTRSA